MSQSSFLFLSANTPWVYALAESIASNHPVHAVRLYDWRTYWRWRPTFPSTPAGAQLRQTLRVLPSGYAGRLERVARPMMRRMIDGWQNQLFVQSGASPWVIAPYPYLVPWLNSVPDERLIYYNLDAYTLYSPSRADAIQQNEARLIGRAAYTLCLSSYQTETLRERYPETADRIVHFPLGVVDDYIHPQPSQPPEADTVGYIGNLTSRVDWRFVCAVARRLPDVRFIFVGGLEETETGGGQSRWRQERADALTLPNVQHIPRIAQEQVKEYYWKFAVSWIPYDAYHPFNQASCPTKVMDAIASGRPVLSTPVPECSLYPAWINVVDSPEAAVSAIKTMLNGATPERARAQIAFATQHTWKDRAATLLELLTSKRPSDRPRLERWEHA